MVRNYLISLLFIGFASQISAMEKFPEKPTTALLEQPQFIEEYSEEFPIYDFADIQVQNDTNYTVVVQPLRWDGARVFAYTVQPHKKGPAADDYDSVKAPNLDKIEKFALYQYDLALAEVPTKSLIIPTIKIKEALASQNAHKIKIIVKPSFFGGLGNFEFNVLPPSGHLKREEEGFIILGQSPLQERRQLFSIVGQLQGKILTPYSKAYEVLNLPKPPDVTQTEEILRNKDKAKYSAELKEHFVELKNKIESYDLEMQLKHQNIRIESVAHKLLNIARSALYAVAKDIQSSA